MKRFLAFLAFLALCWCAFRADGGALLIITEATARGHAGALFDKWIAQQFKSYGMEESVGQATYRRHLFPGWTDAPLALVAGWGLGSFSSAVFFWMAKSTDATVADAITSSATRYGGAMPWEYPIVGDLTLPMDNSNLIAPPVTTYVETMTIGTP